MEYYNLSSNIIACDNFLPEQKVEELYMDFLNNRKFFSTPAWSGADKGDTKEFYSSKCGGFDFWLSWNKFELECPAIYSLKDWFIHQGLMAYAEKNNLPIFSFLKRNLEYDIHTICYNNNGYYNWHQDISSGTILTFNLILNKGNKLNGGDMLFMDDGKIIKIPNKNNFMTVFPSFIHHAIIPLKSKDNKDVDFTSQRFSVQFWVRLS
jgi:Rps23 Pro-64 3,4-dihydroxylase Tpa1-like proline 4-hydroxylase